MFSIAKKLLVIKKMVLDYRNQFINKGRRQVKTIILTSLLIPSLSHADTAVCIAKVSSVGVHIPDVVYLVLEGVAGFGLCKLDGPFYSVPGVSCKHMYATAMLALATDKKLIVYIDNAPTSDCTSVTGWMSSNTRYVAIQQ